MHEYQNVSFENKIKLLDQARFSNCALQDGGNRDQRRETETVRPKAHTVHQSQNNEKTIKFSNLQFINSSFLRKSF